MSTSVPPHRLAAALAVVWSHRPSWYTPGVYALQSAARACWCRVGQGATADEVQRWHAVLDAEVRRESALLAGDTAAHLIASAALLALLEGAPRPYRDLAAALSRVDVELSRDAERRGGAALVRDCARAADRAVERLRAL